jgi:hypothetical protein
VFHRDLPGSIVSEPAGNDLSVAPEQMSRGRTKIYRVRWVPWAEEEVLDLFDEGRGGGPGFK